MKFILEEHFFLTEADNVESSKKVLQNIIKNLTATDFNTVEKVLNELQSLKANIQTLLTTETINATVKTFLQNFAESSTKTGTTLKTIKGLDNALNTLDKMTTVVNTEAIDANAKKKEKYKKDVINAINKIINIIETSGQKEIETAKTVTSTIASLQDILEHAGEFKDEALKDFNSAIKSTEVTNYIVPTTDRLAKGDSEGISISKLLNSIQEYIIKPYNNISNDVEIASGVDDIVAGKNWDERYARLSKLQPGISTRQLLNDFWQQYYTKEFPGINRTFFDDLGDAWEIELEHLGFTDEDNYFIKFIKNAPANIRTKLNASNYGAIHNAYVNGEIGDNDLDIVNHANTSILALPELFTKDTKEFAQYLAAGGGLKKDKVIGADGKLLPVRKLAAKTKINLSEQEAAIEQFLVNAQKTNDTGRKQVLAYLISTYAPSADQAALYKTYKVDGSITLNVNDLNNISKWFSPVKVRISDLTTVLNIVSGKKSDKTT